MTKAPIILCFLFKFFINFNIIRVLNLFKSIEVELSDKWWKLGVFEKLRNYFGWEEIRLLDNKGFTIFGPVMKVETDIFTRWALHIPISIEVTYQFINDVCFEQIRACYIMLHARFHQWPIIIRMARSTQTKRISDKSHSMNEWSRFNQIGLSFASFLHFYDC